MNPRSDAAGAAARSGGRDGVRPGRSGGTRLTDRSEAGLGRSVGQRLGHLPGRWLGHLPGQRAEARHDEDGGVRAAERDRARLEQRCVARLGAAVAAGAGALCCAIGLLACSAWMAGRAAGRPPIPELPAAVVALLVLGLGRCLLRYAEWLVSRDAALRLLARARVRLYERLADLAPAGLHGRPYGRLLRYLAAAVDGMADRRLRAMVPMAAASSAGAVAVAFEWWLLPPAGAALLAGLLAGGVVAPWISQRMAERGERSTAGDSELPLTAMSVETLTLETLRALPELIAYGAAPKRLHDLRWIDRAVAGRAARGARSAALGSCVTALAAGAAALGALSSGVSAVRGGRLDEVLLAVVVLIPVAAVETMGTLAAATRRSLRSGPDAALVRAMLDEPGPVTEPAAPVPLPPPRWVDRTGPADRTAPGRSRGYALSVRGLSARWPGSEGDVLAGLDLELPAGHRVAVLGRGGASRSTLAAVLMRLVDYEGSVTLNGAELRDLAADDVRAVVGLCARDAHVFDTTVAGNVRIVRPGASQADLADALQRTGLTSRARAHGTAVAGAERLRISVARALLARFPVLVMDEPDPRFGQAGADAVLTDLLAATAGRTVLLVTGRRPTPGADAVLRGVDEVITVDRPDPDPAGAGESPPRGEAVSAW